MIRISISETVVDRAPTVLMTAKHYAKSGVSVFPIKSDGSKSPAVNSWTPWKSRIATPEELAQMFRGTHGIAGVCGAVSGNREVIDIDEPSLVEPFEAGVREMVPGLLERLPIVATPRGNHGGRHYHIRLAEPPAGNTTLAKSELRPQWNDDGTPKIDAQTGKQKWSPEALIETRGQGGYVLLPGSPHQCHPTGLTYNHISGPPVAEAPEITAEEHAVLWRVARSFNRYLDETPAAKTQNEPRERDGKLPGDSFAESATWEQILEPGGWVKGRTYGPITHWRRPGKNRGWSATTGCRSTEGRELFCVFSSNAHPFEGANGVKPCTTYNKFAAYALLNHSGDFSAAAKSLAAQGHGEQARPALAKKSPATGLPKINAACQSLPIVTAEAWAALVQANDPPELFTFSNRPVRIERDDDYEPIVNPIDNDSMRHEVARAADWYVMIAPKKKDEEWQQRPAMPPMAVVKDMLAMPRKPLPHLLRIVEAPVFAADGTLQVSPGYHPASRTYFMAEKGFEVPAVSEHPSAAELKQAVGLILEMLHDFPFVGDPDRAHTIAAMLLPFARDLIDGPTPLHLFEKPTPGTGATLLINCLSHPFTGRDLEAMTAGRDEDEWRKRITSKLRKLPTWLLIDNLNHRLDSAAVAAVLTARIWEDRILGASDNVRIPVRSVFMASGNNPAVSTEIARRTVSIRLDAHLDQPWRRNVFRHENLGGWVRENRSQLVWACLTIIRSWLARGRPVGINRLGMYEAWSGVMGGILEAAGIKEFLGNLDRFYDAADEDGTKWRGFVAAWWLKFSHKELKAVDLLELAKEHDLPLGDSDKTDDHKKTCLGKLIGKKRDRVFSVEIDGEKKLNLQIVRTKEKNRASLWKLDNLSNKGSCPTDEVTRSNEVISPDAGGTLDFYTYTDGAGIPRPTSSPHCQEDRDISDEELIRAYEPE